MARPSRKLTPRRTSVMIGGVEYLTVDEAAELTGYAPAYIRRLLRQNKIAAAKKGGQWWVSKDSVLEYKREMDVLGRDKFTPGRQDE